jgi:hypothetical protein
LGFPMCMGVFAAASEVEGAFLLVDE